MSELLDEEFSGKSFDRPLKKCDADKIPCLPNGKLGQSNVWQFFQTEALLSMKNAWLSPIFFWIPRALSKSCFLPIVLNHAKISLY